MLPGFAVSPRLIYLLFAIVWFATSQSLAQGPTPAQVDEALSVGLPDDPAAVIAIVAQKRILLGDLMPRVDAQIQSVLKKSGQVIPEDQLKYARVNLIRGLLAQSIQNKMMREAFIIDQVGTEAADKRAEADARLDARARQHFFENELPGLKEKNGTDDLNELDAKLKEQGSSLAMRQNEFIDMMLGHLFIRAKVERDPDVSIAEINEYYLTHQDEFNRPERATWEQLTVLFSRFSSREEARAAINEMGREAYFGGNVQAVAKAKSHDPFASQGGVHDWTNRGSLASEKLDETIFSVPVNKMSEVIEDGQGLHIVRVIDRKPAGVVSLGDVQLSIEKKLKEEKVAKSQQAVMEDTRDRIPVWSLFPKDTPGSKPLPTWISSRYQSKNVK